MSNKKDDGGPAFPLPIAATGAGDVIHAFDGGMSLRDWFAGQALAPILAVAAQGGAIDDTILTELFGSRRASLRREEIVAALTYAVADAMLAKRAKASGEETA